MPFLLFSKFLQKVKNDFVLFLMELHTSKTLNVILNETSILTRLASPTSPVAILGLVVFRSQLTHVFIHFSSLLTLLLQTISCCSIYAECFQRFMHQNGIA